LFTGYPFPAGLKSRVGVYGSGEATSRIDSSVFVASRNRIGECAVAVDKHINTVFSKAVVSTAAARALFKSRSRSCG